jgi:hypothetical protein
MTLSDPHAYLLAGFSERDVQEIIDDLDYLHQNSNWPYPKDRTTTMLVESPCILREFLEKVRPDALRSAMISKTVKGLVLR